MLSTGSIAILMLPLNLTNTKSECLDVTAARCERLLGQAIKSNDDDMQRKLVNNVIQILELNGSTMSQEGRSRIAFQAGIIIGDGQRSLVVRIMTKNIFLGPCVWTPAALPALGALHSFHDEMFEMWVAILKRQGGGGISGIPIHSATRAVIDRIYSPVRKP